MRALTVHQGWASLMFIPERAKDIENRSWSTSYRGDLLIHAGLAKKSLKTTKEFCLKNGIEFPKETPFGAILGIVEVIDCDRSSDSIWAMADHYHWHLANPRLFAEPIACKGALSLWTPSEQILGKIAAQL